MGTKNYGPGISGYLDPSGRNWETTIFQAAKPVLDKELNLIQDLDEGAGQLALRQMMPSGWLANDFLTKNAGDFSAIFSGGVAPDLINLPNDLIAHLNGWLIRVSNTNANGSNQMSLGVGPVGPGAKRTDIVILEVWRRLLSAAPDVTGKSATGLIWRNGNVKIRPADNLALNFPDDILDAMLASESTKRVQIQYRLRVIQNVDIFAYPYAMNDPSVVARSVPPNSVTPDGTATVFPYVNQSAGGDAGLWVAGDGNPANTLGTVDGFMYAVPLLGVFRRNGTAFDKNTNHNGAVSSPGPSDRPDNLLADVVVSDDIADLRTAVNPNGWDGTEMLDRTYNFLLDNTLRSEWFTTVNGGGVSGHSVLYADEIGVLPGDGVTTGDTPGADFVGEFEAANRTFGDRPHMEIVTVAVPAPGGSWTDGDTFSISPTALAIYPYVAFNWAARNDARVVFHDIVGARWSGNGTAGKKSQDAMPFIALIRHLGEMPVVAVDFTMGAITALALSNETLYVDVLVGYPPGLGLTRTPVGEFGFKSFKVNNPAQLPNVAPVFADPAQFTVVTGTTYLNDPGLVGLDFAHREARLVYKTSTLTLLVTAETTAASQLIQMPERVHAIVAVAKGPPGGPYVPVVNPVAIGATGRILTVALADQSAPGDVWQVQYVAVRPMPQNGEQLTIYYPTRAPQTSRAALIGGTLSVTPKVVSKVVTTITTGSGSPDEGYPYPQAYVQTGGIFPSLTGSFAGEHELVTSSLVSITDFNANTGLLQLPAFLGYVPVPGLTTFLRDPGDVDIEGRSFFKTVPALTYLPNAYAQDFSDQKRHKVVLPFLGELAVDSPLGYAGQLVLLILTRWARLDEINGVFFDVDLNVSTTSASVFRLRNNLLNKRIQ